MYLKYPRTATWNKTAAAGISGDTFFLILIEFEESPDSFSILIDLEEPPDSFSILIDLEESPDFFSMI